MLPSQKIDAELQKATKAGQVPKAIHVGPGLYIDLCAEMNPVYAAQIVGPSDKAEAYPSDDVKEYKDIPIIEILTDDVAVDYLKIIT